VQKLSAPVQFIGHSAEFDGYVASSSHECVRLSASL
jgi:hypothetical protein